MAKKNSLKVSTTLLALVVAVLVAGLVVLEKPAEAAFPGTNGKIAFESNRTTGTGVDNPTGDYEIFAVNPDGTGLTQLTNNQANDFQPVYSPGGGKIAFTSQRDGNDEIYVMSAEDTDADGNGEGQTNLTNKAEDDFLPTWSPDGTKIAFERSMKDFNREIFVMNATGTGQKNLTKSPDDFEFRPAWSPDGTKIAFTSRRDGDLDIFTMNAADGTSQTNLIKADDPDDDRNDSSPEWSPDGTEIAFGRNQDIFKMNADGTGKAAVRVIPGTELTPSWSPDGTQIAFTGRTGIAPSGQDEVFVMNADGSGTVANLTNNTVDDAEPSWQSLDTTGPALASFTPFPNGSTGVVADVSPTATFSEFVNPATLNKKTVQLLEQTTSGKLKKVKATLTYDSGTKTLTIDPNSDLKSGSTYLVIVLGGDKGVKDMVGNAANFADIQWNFTIQ